jgi:endonuclease/exonuclease/phosphatase family metal-dependent hydrolase
MTDAPPLSCATWNIHRARGNDGRVDPARTLGVVLDEVWREGLEALVLTEADAERPPHAGLLDLPRLEAATGLRHVHDGPARWGEESHGFLGVVVLLHPAIRVEEVALVDLPGRCHRGAVVVDAVRHGRPLRLVGAHLSLSQALRVVQMRTLGQHLFRRGARPTVICGDLNEWRPWGGLALSRGITGLGLSGPAAATFPTAWPILPLDRILVTTPGRVARAEVRDGPGIRIASDHRPLAAEVVLGASG